MKITVFGASGGTGKQVVRQALARGYDVVAVVRRPDVFALTDERSSIRQGDVLDPDTTVGNYRTSTTGALPHAYTITRSDLAAAMLDSITDDDLIRRFVAIAN